MIVLRLFGLVIDVLLLPLRLLARRRAARPGAWLTMTIDGPVLDVVAKPRPWQFRRQKATSIHLLDEIVGAMAEDPRVRGLLVTVRSMSAGMAGAASLRAVLARARSLGKEVIVHLPMGGDTKEVYVASVANKVFLGPSTQLAPLGFRSATRYLKRALEHAGVEPQVFACGEFKSAGETLVRDSMSAAQRTQLERLLDAFHESVVSAIAEGRKTSRERASAIIDEAPYFGRAAVEAGLADDVAYDDEVFDKLDAPEPPNTKRPRVVYDAVAWYARKRRPLVRSLRRAPVVAVVPVHGPITHAGGALGGLSTDQRVTRMVRAVRRDRRVLGVILHVDSPGGSALASDLMHHEIERLAREKPVVACMANVAASGGYYVAAPAARIVAQPTTVTGSIGVVAARLDVEPLLTRLGVRTEVLEKGARAALLSPSGPLDASSRAALERELDATYRAFLGVVAAGRKLDVAEVERLARGRVYVGTDAFDVKLVDVLGGFDVALAELKKLLPERARGRVDVVVAKTPRVPVEVPDPSRKVADALLGAILPPRERLLVELVSRGERVLALGPITET